MYDCDLNFSRTLNSRFCFYFLCPALHGFILPGVNMMLSLFLVPGRGADDGSHLGSV